MGHDSSEVEEELLLLMRNNETMVLQKYWNPSLKNIRSKCRVVSVTGTTPITTQDIASTKRSHLTLMA